MTVRRLEHAPSTELMAAFTREANNKLREFAPQNISNMLWAYATLGHSPGTAAQHQGSSLAFHAVAPPSVALFDNA